MPLQYFPVVIPLPAGTTVDHILAIDQTEKLRAFALVKYFPVLDDTFFIGGSVELKHSNIEGVFLEGDHLDIYMCFDDDGDPIGYWRWELEGVDAQPSNE